MPVRTTRIWQLTALGIAAGLTSPRLWLPPAANGQTPPPSSFVEAVEVEVVNVDVAVTDKHGKPVLGLQASDFEVREDGRPVTLSNFVAPAGTAAASAPAPAPTAAGTTPEPEAPASPALPPASVVLYLDSATLRPGPRNEAIDALIRFVEERLPADARVVVAHHDAGLSILSNFDDGHSGAIAALSRVRKLSATGSAVRISEARLLADIQRLDLTEDDDDLPLQIEAWALGEQDRQRRGLLALRSILPILAATAGPRLLVLASGGITVRPGEGLLRELARRDDKEPNRLGDPGEVHLSQELAKLIAAAQAQRVTIWSIDAGDSRGPDVPSADEAGNADTDAPVSTGRMSPDPSAELARLSEATGGSRLISGPQLADSLEAVTDSLSATYSLGYQARDRTPGYHRIDVRVQREGVRLRHRPGYVRRERPDLAVDLALAAVLSGSGPNHFGITAEVGTPIAVGKRQIYRLPIKVVIPLRGLALVPNGAQHDGGIELRFALRDAQGAVTMGEPQRQALSIPHERLAAAMTQFVRYQVNMDLRPGDYRMAVAVSDETGGGIAVTVVPVTVRRD